MLSNATNQPKSTVEFGYMCQILEFGYMCQILVHQQWHSPSSWNVYKYDA